MKESLKIIFPNSRYDGILIRADEVWFVEKGREGASYLTSLAEYNLFFAPIKSLGNIY